MPFPSRGSSAGARNRGRVRLGLGRETLLNNRTLDSHRILLPQRGLPDFKAAINRRLISQTQTVEERRRDLPQCLRE